MIEPENEPERCIDCPCYEGEFGYSVTGYCTRDERVVHPMQRGCRR